MRAGSLKKKFGHISRDLLWNTAGSLLYALASMVLAFFVMHLQGPEDGGIFGFGFSTFGQQMFIVAYFGIRPFQITDVRGEYSFGEYKRFRLLTSLLALAVSGVYLGGLAVLGRYSAYKAVIIGLLAAYKVADGYGDVYESEFQRQGKLYLSGKLLFFRTAVCAGFFMLCLWLSRDLALTALLAALLQLLFLGFYRREAGKQFSLGTNAGEIDLIYRRGKLKPLLRNTWLLFLSVFLDFYVFSAAKYAVDLQLTDADNGVFNILFMPTSVIYLVANFIIRPFMTYLAEAYALRDHKRFSEICRKLLGLIGGLTVLAGLLSWLLGPLVLRIFELLLGPVYAGRLTPYRQAFMLIILGGGIYAAANLFYYILVIIRKQEEIFFVYAAGALLAFFAAPAAVKGFGIDGAAFSYMCFMLVLAAGFALLCGRHLKEERKTWDQQQK